MANNADPDNADPEQTAPIGAVCSGSKLFACTCILKFASTCNVS